MPGRGSLASLQTHRGGFRSLPFSGRKPTWLAGWESAHTIVPGPRWGEKGCTHSCKATRDDKRSSLRTAAAAPTLLRACTSGAADLRDGETETGQASRPDGCGTGQYKCSLEQVRSTALTSGGVRDGPGTFHHINRSCWPRTGTSKLPLSLGDFHAGNWRLWSVQHCHRVGSPATFSAPPCPNPDCATSVSLPHQSTPSPLFTLSTLFPAPQPPSARHCIILGSESSPRLLSLRPPSSRPGRRPHIRRRRLLTPSSVSSSPAAHAVCCVVELAGLSASRSPTWAIRKPQSQQQGQRRCGPRSPFFCFEQRRERARDPLLSPLSPPLSLPLKQGNPSSQKKKTQKSTVPG